MTETQGAEATQSGCTASSSSGDKVAGAAILTMGYQMRTLTDFVEELRAASVDVVIDVRETPWSQRRDFSKASLIDALGRTGIRYVHAWFAGNPKENRRTAATHKECLDNYARYLEEIPDVVTIFEELMGEIATEGWRACLVCYERHPDDCHRSILVEKWQERTETARHIKHLSPDGAPRFLT